MLSVFSLPVYKIYIYRPKPKNLPLTNPHSPKHPTTSPPRLTFSDMLRLGSSKPWPEALKQMTGTSHMDVGPLVEYFQPLLDWLEIQNAGHPTGWTEECPQQELVEAAQWLQDFDKKFEEIRVESTFADWNYTSNITDETSAKSVCPLFCLSAHTPSIVFGTFLQTLPDLVTPLKGHSLSPRSCPPTRSAPSEMFGY